MAEINEEIRKDLLKTSEIVNEENHNVDRIYIRTNEDLKRLFDCFSVKDKDVFTVLASSDQAFSSYYLGAKSVETFDRNRLTKHYYYLRKWLLMYKEQFSPSNNEVMKGNEWLYNLLCLVECKSTDEQASYDYWDSYVMNTLGFLGKKLFHVNKDCNKTPIGDISRLRDIISDKELIFKHQNICEEIDKSNKYDTVIMSNILEYNSWNRENLVKCRDNLDEILRDKGEVICTSLIDYYPSTMERCIFDEKFDYYELSATRRKTFLTKSPIGYCYRKR